jgi:phage repressor protein C with HTH and peptisase S24 domain
MDTIAARLDHAMKAAGFESQSALARSSGVPQPTINRILKGGGKGGPETNTLLKLAAACNVTLSWLQGGESESILAAPALPPSAFKRVVVADDNDAAFTQIKMVKLRLSAGIMGFQADPDYSEGGTLGVPTNWIERRLYVPERLIAIRVKGESMEPSLYEDDIVVVNTADTKLVDGNVYAVNYEGEAVVKRLTRDAGKWWLSSDNPDQRRYHRKVCQGDMCMIVGRVVRKESERI